MEVRVVSDGDTLMVTVDPNWKVKDLKEAIEKEGTVAGIITLGDGELEDDMLLADAGVTSECQLGNVLTSLRWKPPPEAWLYTLDKTGQTVSVKSESRMGGHGVRSTAPLKQGDQRWFMRVSAEHAALGVDTDPTAPGFFGSPTGRYMGVGLEDEPGLVKVSGRVTSPETYEFVLKRSSRKLTCRNTRSEEWKSIYLEDPDARYYVVCYPAHDCSVTIAEDLADMPPTSPRP
eukprot:Sspe_Gene.97661::Locus_71222_Transcript_1_1_Confidence_1.000_Length_843::g.97661::m.97661